MSGGFAYEPLSAADNTFLALENGGAHMHIAATLVFEHGSLGNAAGGLDIDRIRSYVESRLHLIPRYRQRMDILPGLTGLAQLQLPADTDLDSVRRKLAFDLYYVGHCSLWLDLRLLAGTACHLSSVLGLVGHGALHHSHQRGAAGQRPRFRSPGSRTLPRPHPYRAG